MIRILAINPGATSTKIGLFDDGVLVMKETIDYSLQELAPYSRIYDQLELRLDGIKRALSSQHIDPASINAVVGRGGLLPPVKAGAYEINDDIIDCLQHHPVVDHAANMGAELARRIAHSAATGARAFIYDPITVDQFPPIARFSGLNGMDRPSIGHILNMRAVAIKVAAQIGKPYSESRFAVAHIGSGTSVSSHENGRIVELISDDEGPFSIERTGGLPLKQVIHWCYEHTESEMMSLYRRKGGMISYLGTNSAIEVEKRIREGDKYAEMTFHAMAYQLGKSLAACSAVLRGKVDRIILTGGVAHSAILTGWVSEYVGFIAPVVVVPGENELEALALGALRVMRNEEKANSFVLGEDNRE